MDFQVHIQKANRFSGPEINNRIVCHVRVFDIEVMSKTLNEPVKRFFYYYG